MRLYQLCFMVMALSFLIWLTAGNSFAALAAFAFVLGTAYGGYVALSESVWLKPDPPPEVIEFWAEYPEIDFVPEKLAIIEQLGYEPVGHFVMSPSAWTELYYDPMETRIVEKQLEWQGNPTAEAVLEEAKKEITVFRRNPDCFSYAFFVMRKPD